MAKNNRIHNRKRNKKRNGSAANGRTEGRAPALPWGALCKVLITAVFPPQDDRKKHAWEIIRAGSENAATERYFLLFPPLSTPFFTRWDWKWGQPNTTARKLCLQGWTQPLQSRLYCRLPFSPRKKAHSSRHFTPRLTAPPAPGASSPGQAWAAASRTPALPPPAVPGWRAFSPAASAPRAPWPSPAPRPVCRC